MVLELFLERSGSEIGKLFGVFCSNRNGVRNIPWKIAEWNNKFAWFLPFF